MKFNYKKFMAACTAVVCAAAMCGCASDTGTIGTVDGVDIRNGLYLSYMMRAFGNGHTEVSDARAELGDTSEVADLFAETIDGKTASEWIKEDTVNYLKRHVAIEKLCAEKGIELSAEEISRVAADIGATWDSSEIDYYGIGYMVSVSQIYGEKYRTMGDYYSYVGIGEETLKDAKLNQMKEDKLFMALYDTDGEAAVTAEEYNAYLTENYAAVKIIEMPFDDMYGLNLDPTNDADEIQAIKDKAQSYVDRLNAGESFIDVKYEFDLEKAKNDAAVKAEESFEERTDHYTQEDVDAAIEEAIANATAEKAENEYDTDIVIGKDSSSYGEELTEYIWNLEAGSDAVLYEEENIVYVIVKSDITANENWQTGANRDNTLHAIKDDAFEELLNTTSAGYKVELDAALVEKYAPEKYRGFEQE